MSTFHDCFYEDYTAMSSNYITIVRLWMHEENQLLRPLKRAEPEFCVFTNLSYTLYHPPWLLSPRHQHKFRVALIRHRFRQLCSSYKPLMKSLVEYKHTAQRHTPFLHSASDQKLELGKVWEQSYKANKHIADIATHWSACANRLEASY